ncbi:MAG: hypothetical protein KAR05_12250 [Candidatus Omnitrophica bacterium]|nr:hypothetical protein [Candidatus Omnitrophota bacterium]
MPRSDSTKEKKVIEGKVFAILAYLSILCIIPLLFKKDNAFVLSHSKQGLVLFVGQVGVFIIHIIFPWILKPGLFVLGVLSFVGIIAVLRGRYISLPVIAGIADKITL